MLQALAVFSFAGGCSLASREESEEVPRVTVLSCPGVPATQTPGHSLALPFPKSFGGGKHMIGSVAKPARALALRRHEKTWQQVASSFGISQRIAKRWVKKALLAEQHFAQQKAAALA